MCWDDEGEKTEDLTRQQRGGVSFRRRQSNRGRNDVGYYAIMVVLNGFILVCLRNRGPLWGVTVSP